jgi:hypothetical protein
MAGTQRAQFSQKICEKIDFQHFHNRFSLFTMLKLAEMWQKTIDFRQLQSIFSPRHL